MWSAPGRKHTSWESGFEATGRLRRIACSLVTAFGHPPTGKSDRDSSRCPSEWSMYDWSFDGSTPRSNRQMPSPSPSLSRDERT